jgi:acyl-CoA reductase-like NAD-dependent aldehyde dehydrogenase
MLRNTMTPTDKLSLWGAALAAARDAERAAAQQVGDSYDPLRRKARALREHADRLHREVYRELGPVRASDRPGKCS